MAQAFTKHRTGAIFAYLLSLLIVGFYALRRQVYESPDGNGMVILGRYRVWVDVGGVALLFIGVFAGIFVLGTVVGPVGLGVLTLLWVLVALGVTQLNSGSAETTPVGSETPKGKRWQLAALAQRPGTQMSALLLTRRLVESVPPGDVVVAVAADDELRRAYERFGFSTGKRRRVFQVAT